MESNQRTERQRKLVDDVDNIVEQLALAIHEGSFGVVVVKAPPGSGKTETMLRLLGHTRGRGMRIAIAAQTNAQCEDFCERFLDRYRDDELWRFRADGMDGVPAEHENLKVTFDGENLPQGPCVVVATTSKWGLNKDFGIFDLVIVDEAWQMAWADFTLLGRVGANFILIGDPGQIPPVVTVDTRRWDDAQRPPHRATPEVILADPSIHVRVFDLPVCFRLPADSVDIIRSFYDFPFDAFAEPGSRALKFAGSPKEQWARLLLILEGASMARVTIPTPEVGPPLDCDHEVASLAADVAMSFLIGGCMTRHRDDDVNFEPITPSDIGIVATHRIMNHAILECLPTEVRGEAFGGIRVDTPERWQGLQRKLMVAVHPLSGVVHPSSFDLETGRLCVMASRHQVALVVVSRDHVGQTLDAHMPWAEQSLGCEDVVGRGHHQHTAFWDVLSTRSVHLEHFA